jgi:hypothetical protein
MPEQTLREVIGWTKNKYPFTLELVTDVVVGHKTLYNSLFESLKKNKRIILVEGPYGAGKSFTLKYFMNNPPKDAVFVYLTGDYSRSEVIKNIVATIHDQNPYIEKKKFFGLIKERTKVPAPDIVENMLTDYVNKNINNKKLIFIWDDIQRVKNADMIGLSVLLLEHTGTYIILCGLKEGVSWLENEVSFLNRGMEALEPEPLAKEDLKELIKKRIDWAGGSGFKPFTEEAVDYLATRFRGARDLLNVCNEVFSSLESGYSGSGFPPKADMAYIENYFKDIPRKSADVPRLASKEDVRKKFSNLESLIFDILLNNESKTSPQLVEELQKDRGTIAKTIERMMDKYPGMILQEKVEGKRRPENSYRIVEDMKRTYAPL